MLCRAKPFLQRVQLFEVRESFGKTDQLTLAIAHQRVVAGATLAMDDEHVADIARLLADREYRGAARSGLAQKKDGKLLVRDVDVELLDLADLEQIRHPVRYGAAAGLVAHSLSSTTEPSASCRDQMFTGVRLGWREKRKTRRPATPISTTADFAPARTRLSRASP